MFSDLVNAALQGGMSKEDAEIQAYWQTKAENAYAAKAVQDQINDLKTRIEKLEEQS